MLQPLPSRTQVVTLSLSLALTSTLALYTPTPTPTSYNCNQMVFTWLAAFFNRALSEEGAKEL